MAEDAPAVHDKEERINRGGGGGYSGNFWVGVCLCDSGILTLHQNDAAF